MATSPICVCVSPDSLYTFPAGHVTPYLLSYIQTLRSYELAKGLAPTRVRPDTSGLITTDDKYTLSP